jgi:hypothetical protein
MVTFFRRMIGEMVSPLNKIAVLDPQRRRKRREELNALLASNSEKNGPCGATAWKKIVKDARRAFEGCFILLEYVRLCWCQDVRIFDMQNLRQKYPEVEAVEDTEAAMLLVYRNAMMSAMLVNSENLRKDMLIESCVRISEGAGAATKYARGGGKQRVATNNREIIFERESGLPPKACREGCTVDPTSVSRANTMGSKGSRVHCGQVNPRKKRILTAPTPGVESCETSGKAAKRPRARALQKVPCRPAEEHNVSALAHCSEMELIYQSFQNEGPLSTDEGSFGSQASEGWFPAVMKQEPASCELRRDIPQGAALRTDSFGDRHSVAAIKCEPISDTNDIDCDTRCPSPLGCELGMQFEPGLDCDATADESLGPAIRAALRAWCPELESQSRSDVGVVHLLPAPSHDVHTCLHAARRWPHLDGSG